MHAAVNCLVTEPTRKTISGRIGTASSTSARPYPFRSTGRPSWTTSTAAPGPSPG